MAWKLTAKAKGMEPLPGVPMRELSDDEFRDFGKWYADFNHFPRKALEESGFWQHVEDKPSSEKKEA